MNSLSSYNSTTKQAARLFGDATLRGVQNQIRLALANPVEGAIGFPTLAEIGIKTNKSGVLELDSTKFDRATAANSAAVSQLFASDNGLATRFDNVIKNYLSSDGVLSSRLDGVNKQISGITDQQDKLNTRMAALQTRYLKQFNAMDALVGQLQGTGSYLTQMLDNLPGFVAK